MAARLTVASFNTRGLPLTGTNRAERYASIGAAFESSDVDVVAFQEVVTYQHLRQLVRGMPSFRHVSYRPSLIGPAGWLVTLSRLPVAGTRYQRFPISSHTAGLPRFTGVKAALKGSLVTKLARHRLCVVNTHPIANIDGDWSPSNRFQRLQCEQLAVLARLAERISPPSIVCGDFNVARESTLFRDFMADTGLADVFEGQCPPTFHSYYLSDGRPPFCIDFILATDSVSVENAGTLFSEEVSLPSGRSYLSDHVGLRATVVLPG